MSDPSTKRRPWTLWILLTTIGLVASGCNDGKPEGLPSAPSTVGVPEVQPSATLLLTPEDLKWTAAPPPYPPGTQFVLLYGDASKEESFANRVLLPDGARFEPHTHPRDSHVLVLQGTLHLGFGQEFNEENARAFPAGSYLIEPANMPHFAFVKGDTVLHTEAVGPFTLDYLDPVGAGSTGTP